MLRYPITLTATMIALTIVNHNDASAIDVTGPITGRLVSASATTSAGGQAVVWTVPPTVDFILTQHCGYSMNLFGSSFGKISGNQFDETGCKTFTPGVALPPNEILTRVMDNAYSPGLCLITGITQEK